MELINPIIQNFATDFTTKEETLLKEISDYTNTHHKEPQMLSGHIQGKFLQMISYMIQPKRILEIGTFTGYSSLCLAVGLTSDGLLHTIELRQETADIATGFFSKSPLGEKIKLHVGEAADIIPTLEESWDLIFIDADKPGYIKYFELVIERVKKNGFILADNIFFHGESFISEPKGKSARAIKKFNQFIQQRTDIDKIVIPIRDGLYLLRKI